MRRQTRIATAWATALATLGLAAYGGASESHATTTGDDLPRGSEPVTLDPADFTVEVDNPYWPMRPGSTWVYRGTDTTGTLQRIVITVTDETKAIANGVEARVVHDVVTESGTPVEITDDWYAQDKAGNVWYLGEHVTNYENGQVVDHAGSFEAASSSITSSARPSRIATQLGHTSHGSPSRRSVQLTALARMRAIDVLPVPRGPAKR